MPTLHKLALTRARVCTYCKQQRQISVGGTLLLTDFMAQLQPLTQTSELECENCLSPDTDHEMITLTTAKGSNSPGETRQSLLQLWSHPLASV